MMDSAPWLGRSGLPFSTHTPAGVSFDPHSSSMVGVV